MSRILSTEKVLAMRRLLIALLAGLLAFYHAYTVYRALAASHAVAAFDHIQIVLKCLVAVSLLLVIARKSVGLWGMWFGVIALIGTQYWAHFGLQTADFTEARSVFSYLRGLVVPAMITMVYPRQDM